jgi:[acyl-carrier-protein] S-malonyltransferase
MRLIWLFPGQGAQYVGMGAELRAASPDAADVFDAAGEALGYDLAALCAIGPAETLGRTLHAQPAVVATSLAALAALRAAARRRNLDLQPCAVAGHSVGELAAMAASEAFDVATILRLVAARARAMEDVCAVASGGMAAVLGLDEGQVVQACAVAAAQTQEAAAVANFNAPDQLVVAGTARGLAVATAESERRGARRVVPLKVAGAFHTPLMQPAVAAFAPAVRAADARPARVPVILNTSARDATQPDELRTELERQLALPVRWSQTMARCAALKPDAFVELGPGQVLSGLARRAVRGVPTLNVQDAASLEATLEALACLAAG